MRFTFRLRFHTRYGQSLWLTGNHEIFGDEDPLRAIPLHYRDGESWELTFLMPRSTAPDAEIAYHYVLKEADGSLVHDWGEDRVFNPARVTQDELMIVDAWNPAEFYQNALYTKPFKEVFLRDDPLEEAAESVAPCTHVFRVKAPALPPGQTLCLLGADPALGGWCPGRAVPMRRPTGQDWFSAGVKLEDASFPLAYKYALYDRRQEVFLRFEDGANRTLEDSVAQSKQTWVNDGFAVLPFTHWKGAGVAIPVFSLRSESSFGVGDFGDLKLLAEWCQRAGLKLIQILPVNDTRASGSWTDSYPYSAISAFALHPLYLNLRAWAVGVGKEWLAELEEERTRLNALSAVDYEAVIKIKLAFARRIFQREEMETFRSQDYRGFYAQNRDWLDPYAAFCCLRDRYGTADFETWPDHTRYDAGRIGALVEHDPAARKEMALTRYLQFHLHTQLQQAALHAHTCGVVLKGDIPIGVSRCGADVWQQPELFHTELQAGAPPDAFAVTGQNWGFPTYNWLRMKEDGFAWWKRRFSQMSLYFDAFRIDHILGFFRIWSIPIHAVEGILGFFVPVRPVLVSELPALADPSARDRWLAPFIRETTLEVLFGVDAGEIKMRFLTPAFSGRYALKREFATQRQVEAHFAALPANARNQRLKQGLYSLISNVILLSGEAEEGSGFHFRFGMENTDSFRDLPVETQRRLREMYVDYFFRRQDDLWKQEALGKLPVLKRGTRMLVCGEDLGLVPRCVPEVMRQLGLLSLEIQRMPKDPARTFFRPGDAPYLSVVTPSTHDMSTIRGWWEEDPELTSRFFKEEMGQPGSVPRRCEPWISKEIVRQHLASGAMWSIFQLQDILGMDEAWRCPNPADERINIPGIPRHYWRYRMPGTLEHLRGSDALNNEIKSMIENTGR